MEHNVVVRMAKVLYGMVLAVFVFNLLVLPLVPGYTMMAYEGMGMGTAPASSCPDGDHALPAGGWCAPHGRSWWCGPPGPCWEATGRGYGPECGGARPFSWAAASVPPCSCGRPGASCPRSSPDSLSAVQCPVHEAGGGQLLGHRPAGGSVVRRTGYPLYYLNNIRVGAAGQGHRLH